VLAYIVRVQFDHQPGRIVSNLIFELDRDAKNSILKLIEFRIAFYLQTEFNQSVLSKVKFQGKGSCSSAFSKDIKLGPSESEILPGSEVVHSHLNSHPKGRVRNNLWLVI
jgi:hypothetical protein